MKNSFFGNALALTIGAVIASFGTGCAPEFDPDRCGECIEGEGDGCTVIYDDGFPDECEAAASAEPDED